MLLTIDNTGEKGRSTVVVEMESTFFVLHESEMFVQLYIPSVAADGFSSLSSAPESKSVAAEGTVNSMFITDVGPDSDQTSRR